MALTPQLIDIPIIGGVDEKTDERVSMRWATSYNVQRPKVGGISRRNSAAWLSNSNSVGSQLIYAPRRMRPVLAQPAIVADDETLLPRVLPYSVYGNNRAGFNIGPLNGGGTNDLPRSVISDHWVEPIFEGIADVTSIESAYTFFQSGIGNNTLTVAQVSGVLAPTGPLFTVQHYVPGADPTDLSRTPAVANRFLYNTTFTNVRVFAKAIAGSNGKVACVSFQAGTANKCQCDVYNPVTGTFFTVFTLTADAVTVCDGRIDPTNTYLLFAYVKNATTIQVQRMNLTTGAIASQTITTGTQASALCIVESDQDLLRVMWAETTAKQVTQATSTCSTFGAFTTQATVMGAVGGVVAQITAAESSTIPNSAGGLGTVWIEVPVSASYNQVQATQYNATTLNSLPGGSWIFQIGYSRLVSKALAERGGAIALIAYDQSTTQRTYFLAAMKQKGVAYIGGGTPLQMQCVGKTMYAVAGGGLVASAGLPACQPIPTLSYATMIFGAQAATLPSGCQMPGLQIVEAPSATVLRKAPKLLRWMFDPQRGLSAETAAGSQFLAGGALYQHDGYALVENGFWLAPEPTPGAISATGAAGFLSAGTYQVCFVYSAIDDQGNIVRSAPSIPQSVTAAALNTISAQCQTLCHTLKWTHQSGDSFTSLQPVSIELYRTVANGTIFYRDTSVALNNNNYAASAINFTTSVSDATIQSQQILYTTGALNNFTPDGQGVMGAALGRLFIADPLNENAYRWSQAPLTGQQLTFCNEFADTLPLGAPPGRITAFMSMDDKCIIAKRHGIWYLSGDGTTNAGTGGFTKAFKLPFDDIGVLNQSAWVLIPAGIIFVSEKGVYLLGHDLSLTYVGKDVENYFFDYPPVDPTTIPGSEARAMLVGDQNQARFVFRSSSLGSRKPLIAVYDYAQGTWDYHEPMATADVTKTFAVSDLLSVNGQIYQSQYALDGTAENQCVAQERYDFLPEATGLAAIPKVTLTSGWIKFTGINGFQRIYNLYFLIKTLITSASYPSIPQDWSLTFGIAYDYNPTIVETKTMTYAMMTDNGTAPQFEVGPARQKCSAIQFTLSETFPTAVAGFLWQLDSVQAEVGALGRGNRLAAAKSA